MSELVEPPPEHCPGTGTELSGIMKLQFKETKKETVLRIRDVYPGSEFFHPGSRVKMGQKGFGKVRFYQAFSEVNLTRSEIRVKICTTTICCSCNALSSLP